MKEKMLLAILGVTLMISACQRRESLESLQRQGERLEREIINSVAAITQYRAIYEKILREAPESELAPQACYKLAKLNEIFGHYQDAVAYYQKLLVQYPDQPICAEGLFNLAQIYELHLNQKSDAAAVYGQLVHFYPEEKFAFQGLLRSGQLMSEQGKWEEAVFYFEKLVARYPDHEICADVYFRMGDILEHKIKDTTRAAEMYRKIMDKFPRSTWAKFARERWDNASSADQSPGTTGR